MANTDNNKKRKLTTNRKANEAFWGWFFILPTIIGLLILNIIPAIQTVYESFFKTGAFGKGNIFVGFENYSKMFADASVWQALWNTIKYAVLEVPLSIIIALVLAVFLDMKIRGRTAFRTIYFLPMVAAPAAVAMVWRWLYNSEFGLINHILNTLGISSVNWLSNTKGAIASIAVVGIWSIIGNNIIIFLAGLQEIPKDYYEASRIDGASGVQQFLKITVPLITPSLFFVSVTRVIASFQVFDSIYMMIGRTNPAMPKTRSLVYLFYDYSFIQGNKGYGSAIVILLLILIMLITVVQVKLQDKVVHYD